MAFSNSRISKKRKKKKITIENNINHQQNMSETELQSDKQAENSNERNGRILNNLKLKVQNEKSNSPNGHPNTKLKKKQNNNVNKEKKSNQKNGGNHQHTNGVTKSKMTNAKSNLKGQQNHKNGKKGSQKNGKSNINKTNKSKEIEKEMNFVQIIKQDGNAPMENGKPSEPKNEEIHQLQMQKQNNHNIIDIGVQNIQQLHQTGVIHRLTQDIIGNTQMLVMYNQSLDLEAVIKRLEKVMEDSEVNVKISAYGSYKTNLMIPSSDIDISIEIEEDQKMSTIEKDNLQKQTLYKIEKTLQNQNFVVNLKSIIHASIPIIKYVDVACQKMVDGKYVGQSVDLSINSNKGVEAVKFINIYKKEYPAFEPLALILKSIIAEAGLNNVFKGGISSYSICIMIVYYLQQQNAETPLGELLVGLLRFYGFVFDIEKQVVDLNNKNRTDAQQLWDSQHNFKINMNPIKICIIDPGDEHNIVSRSTFHYDLILGCIQSTYSALMDDISNPTPNPLTRIVKSYYMHIRMRMMHPQFQMQHQMMMQMQASMQECKAIEDCEVIRQKIQDLENLIAEMKETISQNFTNFTDFTKTQSTIKDENETLFKQIEKIQDSCKVISKQQSKQYKELSQLFKQQKQEINDYSTRLIQLEKSTEKRFSDQKEQANKRVFEVQLEMQQYLDEEVKKVQKQSESHLHQLLQVQSSSLNNEFKKLLEVQKSTMEGNLKKVEKQQQSMFDTIQIQSSTISKYEKCMEEQNEKINQLSQILASTNEKNKKSIPVEEKKAKIFKTVPLSTRNYNKILSLINKNQCGEIRSLLKSWFSSSRTNPPPIDINFIDEDTNCTLLYTACLNYQKNMNTYNDDIPLDLLRCGARPDLCNNDLLCSELVIASKCNSVKLVKALLNKGANINYHSSKVDSPLHNAIINENKCPKNMEIIKSLLSTKHKSDIHLLSLSNISPLYSAVNMENLEAAKLLIRRCKSEEEKNKLINEPRCGAYNFSILMEAINRSGGDTSFVEFLIEHGADVNGKSSNVEGNLGTHYETPFSIALHFNYKAIIFTLINKGMIITSEAYELAVKHGDMSEVIERMKARGDTDFFVGNSTTESEEDNIPYMELDDSGFDENWKVISDNKMSTSSNSARDVTVEQFIREKMTKVSQEKQDTGISGKKKVYTTEDKSYIAKKKRINRSSNSASLRQLGLSKINKESNSEHETKEAEPKTTSKIESKPSSTTSNKSPPNKKRKTSAKRKSKNKRKTSKRKKKKDIDYIDSLVHSIKQDSGHMDRQSKRFMKKIKHLAENDLAAIVTKPNLLSESKNILKNLNKNKTSIDATWVDEENGSTFLHYAVRTCSVSLIKHVIQLGVKLDHLDNQKRNALHVAMIQFLDACKTKKIVDIVKDKLKSVIIHLLKEIRGVNENIINAADNKRNTPLHYAVQSGDLQIVKRILLEPEALNKDEIIKTDYIKKVAINTKNADGHVPLAVAVWNYHGHHTSYIDQIVPILIEHPSFKMDNKTWYDVAKEVARSGFDRTFNIILKKKPKIVNKDFNGNDNDDNLINYILSESDDRNAVHMLSIINSVRSIDSSELLDSDTLLFALQKSKLLCADFLIENNCKYDKGEIKELLEKEADKEHLGKKATKDKPTFKSLRAKVIEKENLKILKEGHDDDDDDDDDYNNSCLLIDKPEDNLIQNNEIRGIPLNCRDYRNYV